MNNSNRTIEKQSRLKNRTELAMLCLLLLGLHAGAQFSDNFDGPTLNPFWSSSTGSGYVHFPCTTNVHSGSQSVELVTTNSTSDKGVWLGHNFPAPVYGTVSVWIYDNAANVSSANYIALEIDTTNWSAQIMTFDYSFGDGATYRYAVNSASISTGIARTIGWHHFTISSLPNSLSILLDDLPVYTGPGGQAFTLVMFRLSGPSWRPAWRTQFDDFQFAPDPVLEAHTYAGVTLSGSVGTSYEIQYSDGLDSTNWQTLTDITLTNSPFLYFDATSANAPKRFYRALVK